MNPPQRANFKQNWELISFVKGSGSSYRAVSTAYVFPPVPFETFLPASAQKVRDDLSVDGLETYAFRHDEPNNPGLHAGKSSVIEGGCYGHFEEVYRAVTARPVANLEEELKSMPDFGTPFEIVTFVYKSWNNGWVVVNFRKDGDDYRLSLYPCANKADSSRIISVHGSRVLLDQETLYYDPSVCLSSVAYRDFFQAFKRYFQIVIDEVDNTSGHFSGMEGIRFDKACLKRLLGID